MFFFPFQIIVISSILHYTPLVYEGSAHKYVYPDYANVIGWLIAASSMSIIPLYIIYYLLSAKGTLKEVMSVSYLYKKLRYVISKQQVLWRQNILFHLYEPNTPKLSSFSFHFNFKSSYFIQFETQAFVSKSYLSF